MTGFQYRVLFADDDPVIRRLSVAVLESQHYQVHAVEDGLAALNSLDSALPDIIVSDLQMPRMSGFEFLQIVRTRFPHLPVIAVRGAYLTSANIPNGVLADAFLQKGTTRRMSCWQP